MKLWGFEIAIVSKQGGTSKRTEMPWAHDAAAEEKRPNSTPGPPSHRRVFPRVPKGCVSGNQEALVDGREPFLARKFHLINVEEKPEFRMITTLQCPVK